MRKWIQLAELPFYTQRMTAENWQAPLPRRKTGAAEAAALLPSGWCWKALAAPAADRER